MSESWFQNRRWWHRGSSSWTWQSVVRPTSTTNCRLKIKLLENFDSSRKIKTKNDTYDIFFNHNFFGNLEKTRRRNSIGKETCKTFHLPCPMLFRMSCRFVVLLSCFSPLVLFLINKHPNFKKMNKSKSLTFIDFGEERIGNEQSLVSGLCLDAIEQFSPAVHLQLLPLNEEFLQRIQRRFHRLLSAGNLFPFIGLF